jgi:aspartyl-tRNA(Asn)/glutamyl-tRNA(Gln) amidotransferase subunit A
VTALAIEPIADLAPRIASRELSPVELVGAVLDRIDALDPRLAAYVTVDRVAAMAAAREAEAEIGRSGARGPLHGIPVAIKDNLAVSGWPTTNGSPRMTDHVTAFDAAVVERLRTAGAIILGKTAMHEWAMGGTCSRQQGGPVRNPWDPARVPGGSSGGSAVVVAAGLACAAIGTDGMGSIRTPAAYCGVVGLKPSYGLVSRYGELPPTSSWTDHVGPLTRTVADARLLLAALAGRDTRDPTSRTRPGLAPADRVDATDIRVGLVRSALDGDIRPGVRAAIDEVAARLAARGAAVVTIDLSSLAMMPLVGPSLGTETQDVLLPLALEGPDAFANADIRYRVLAAEFVRAADVRRARAIALTIRADILRALETVDVLLLPTTTTPAFEIGASEALVGDGEIVDLARPGGQARLTTRLTQPFNIAGTPAISLPSPSLVDGLPVGIQLVGRPWGDDALLDVAALVEADGAAYIPPPGLGESGHLS